MKKNTIILFFLVAVTHYVSAHPFSPKEKMDTVSIVVEDSLDWYRYHVSNMTLLVKDKSVHYTVVFDMEKQCLRPRYQQIGGSVYPYNAIKGYGEKYRKGILIYIKESEVTNE